MVFVGNFKVSMHYLKKSKFSLLRSFFFRLLPTIDSDEVGYWRQGGRTVFIRETLNSCIFCVGNIDDEIRTVKNGLRYGMWVAQQFIDHGIFVSPAHGFVK